MRLDLDSTMKSNHTQIAHASLLNAAIQEVLVIRADGSMPRLPPLSGATTSLCDSVATSMMRCSRPVLRNGMSQRDAENAVLVALSCPQQRGVDATQCAEPRSHICAGGEPCGIRDALVIGDQHDFGYDRTQRAQTRVMIGSRKRARGLSGCRSASFARRPE